MNSENTLEFEVKNSKLQKRTKKRNKSEGLTREVNCTTGAQQDIVSKLDKTELRSKKYKDKKRKLKSIHKSNGTKDETITNNEQSRNSKNRKTDQVCDELEEKAVPPKKAKRVSIMQTDEEQVPEHTEEMDKNNPKVPKLPSKRQAKREKAEKRENEKRETSRLEHIQKGLNYVSKWKHARSEWKFEKLRQKWLIDNLLDEGSIPEDIFPTVLEYFEGCKGMAREQLLKKGMDVIKKVEEDEDNRDEIMESVVYKRARQLLQALPTET